MTRRRVQVPRHLAIIMDGNGRWATRRGRPRWMGHVKGAQTVRRVVTHCARCGVEQLTLYAFSSDNWKRPAEEVKLLFDLFASHLDRQLPELEANGIRLSVFGRRDRLPQSLTNRIQIAEHRTEGGRRMHLRVAIDYSSRAAIQRAAHHGALSFTDTQGIQDMHENQDAQHTPHTQRTPHTPQDAQHQPAILPAVDLVLRTGGERRLSDFLLWESAYAELAFLDVSFPDLSTSDLDSVFADYASRERRFGDVPILESA